MLNIQSIVETVEDSNFYLVEHVFENAIKRFNDDVDVAQNTLVSKYVDLIKEGKMSKALEVQLSEELTPYLEEYANLYAPYLFQDITESEAKFDFSSYRVKVGNDVVLELFGSAGKKLASVGAILAAGATSAWAIKDPEGMSSAIDGIIAKVGNKSEEVIEWVKKLFVDNEKKPDTVVAILKDAAAKPSQDIKTTMGSVPQTLSDKFVGGLKTFWNYAKTNGVKSPYDK